MATYPLLSRVLSTYSRSIRRHASHSSHSWLERQKKDIYKKMARYDNYRARSAFKLIQIDDKYKFLKPGQVVIEAGAAPGSWTQVICERLKLAKESIDETNDENDRNKKPAGLCVAIDIAGINPVEGAICLGNADFTSPFTQGKILTWLGDRKADCVLSDMAPNATGQKDFSHTKIMELVRSLLPFAFAVLKSKTGVLLVKIWDGAEREEFTEEMRLYFDLVHTVKPDASRGDSSEMYILCRKFKGKDIVEQIKNGSRQ